MSEEKWIRLKPNLNEERRAVGFRHDIFKYDVPDTAIPYLKSEGSLYSSIHEKHIPMCRVIGIGDIDQYIIPETAIEFVEKKIKFKLPEIVAPTEERMKEIATEWWEKQKGVNFRDWNDKLKMNSFDYRICKLPTSVVDMMVFTDGYTDAKMDALVEELDKLLRPLLDTMQCENGFFVKLISRSPKDYLADETNFGKPKPLKTIREAAMAIISSMRCFEDLVMLKYLDIASIVVRPYINFHPSDEWRVYVKDKKVVGISQYYYGENFPQLTDIATIKANRHIRWFMTNKIIPNVNLDDYVVDVVTELRGHKSGTKLLEMNPWGISDPCLFVNYQSFDGEIRYNK